MTLPSASLSATAVDFRGGFRLDDGATHCQIHPTADGPRDGGRAGGDRRGGEGEREGWTYADQKPLLKPPPHGALQLSAVSDGICRQFIVALVLKLTQQ